MKYLKGIFKIISVIGVFLAIGTAGASDMEMEIGKILMTDGEFYFRVGMSVLMFSTGIVGNKFCDFISYKQKKVKTLHGSYEIYNIKYHTI